MNRGGCLVLSEQGISLSISVRCPRTDRPCPVLAVLEPWALTEVGLSALGQQISGGKTQPEFSLKTKANSNKSPSTIFSKQIQSIFAVSKVFYGSLLLPAGLTAFAAQPGCGTALAQSDKTG